MKGGHQHITRGIKHSLASKNGLLNCFTTLRGTDIILFLQLIVKWLEDTGYWQNVWHDINSLVPMEYQKYQNGGHCMQLFQIFECKFSVQCDDNVSFPSVHSIRGSEATMEAANPFQSITRAESDDRYGHSAV